MLTESVLVVISQLALKIVNGVVLIHLNSLLSNKVLRLKYQDTCVQAADDCLLWHHCSGYMHHKKKN